MRLVLNTLSGFHEYGLAAAYVSVLQQMLSAHMRRVGASPALVEQLQAYKALEIALIREEARQNMHNPQVKDFALNKALKRCRRAHKAGISPGKLSVSVNVHVEPM